MKQTAEEREKELKRHIEYRAKTREIREMAEALPPGNRAEAVCPFCGGTVDIERLYETHYKMQCRQCWLREIVDGY